LDLIGSLIAIDDEVGFVVLPGVVDASRISHFDVLVLKVIVKDVFGLVNLLLDLGSYFLILSIIFNVTFLLMRGGLDHLLDFIDVNLFMWFSIFRIFGALGIVIRFRRSIDGGIHWSKSR
jgi:hypothetical protein